MNRYQMAEGGAARPMSLVWLAGLCVAMGGALGMATNAVNGLVSEVYFRAIMRWGGVVDIYRAVLAQGLFEGLIYGAVFAVVYVLVVGVSARGRAGLGFAAAPLWKAAAVSVGCWVVGGLIAMGLVVLSPEFYATTFVGLPGEFGEMLRYAWVGGSIWGAMFGGVLGLVMICVVFPARWRVQAESGTMSPR